jgi:hypothetical protein
MKIVKNNVTENTPKKTYPYFGKTNNGTIVLFVSNSTGMLIDDPTAKHRKFEISTEWAEEIFKLIPNYSITITTEE